MPTQEEDRHTRNRMLFGNDFEKLQKARVILLGVGGVGSFCLDGLYRSGVGHITVVDFDEYDVTNLNRQLGSDGAVGHSKVKTLAKNYPGIVPVHEKVDERWVWNFDFEPFDLVLDAIDDIPAKVALARKCYKKLISSMGSAKKTDPTRIQVTDIWKTHGDPFASVFKRNLRRVDFTRNFAVIHSTEAPQCKEKGSFVGVTGAFGLALCAEGVKRLRRKESFAVEKNRV